MRQWAELRAGARFRAKVGIAPSPPHNEHDVAVFTALCKLWPEVRFHNRALCVEAEAVLSGTGIPVLYRAICKVSGDGAVLRTAPEILTAAQAGTDENAVALARIFRTHLAVVCGDLAVTFKAQGGVFFVRWGVRA